MSATPSGSQQLQWLPVALGGLLAGALDLTLYLVMHLVVLPLSQVRPRVPPVADVVGELFSHVFLFGIVIALAVARVTTTEVRRRAGVS